MSLNLLELPIIQSVAKYLTLREFNIFRLTCKAVNLAANSGQVKLEGSLHYKQPVAEKIVKYCSGITGKMVSIYDSAKIGVSFHPEFVLSVVMHHPDVKKLTIPIDVGPSVIYPEDLTFKNDYGTLRIINPMSYANVKKLRILTSAIDVSSFIDLLTSPYAKNIVKLKLEFSLITKQIIDEIAKLPCLKKLTFAGKGMVIEEIDFRHFGETLAKMPDLQKLRFCGCGLNATRIISLLTAFDHAMDKPSCLKRFKIDGNRIGTIPGNNEVFDLIPKCMPLLEQLHLGNNNLDETHAVHIARIVRKLPHLKNLTIGSNSLAGSIAHIIDALPSTIQQLYMHGCCSDGDDNEYFRQALVRNLPRMDSLWGLGLNGNSFTGEDIVSIVKSAPQSLRDIGITSTHLEDTDMKPIARCLSYQCPNIRFVYLYNCGFRASTRVSTSGLRQFNAELVAKHAILVTNFDISRYVKTI